MREFFPFERGVCMRTFPALKWHRIWSRAQLGYLMDILKDRVAPAMCNSAHGLFPENAIAYFFPVPNCQSLFGAISTRLHPPLRVTEFREWTGVWNVDWENPKYFLDNLNFMITAHPHLIIVQYLLKLNFLPTTCISLNVNSLPTMSGKSASCALQRIVLWLVFLSRISWLYRLFLRTISLH